MFHVGVAPAWGLPPPPEENSGGGEGKFDSKNFALACECVLAYFDRVSGVYEVFLTFFLKFSRLQTSLKAFFLDFSADLRFHRGRGRQKSAFVHPLGSQTSVVLGEGEHPPSPQEFFLGGK